MQYPYADTNRSEIIDMLPRTCRRLLDVGCGRGGVGSEVKKRFGWEVWGVEPVPAIAECASRRIDKVVCAEYGPDIGLPKAWFDVITFLDVLEHMADPWSALRIASDLLVPEGCVIASVPNMRYWPVLRCLIFDADWRYEESGVLDRAHLRFFTRRSLIRLFSDTGYRVELVKGINAIRFKRLKLLVAVLRPWANDLGYMQFALRAHPQRE